MTLPSPFAYPKKAHVRRHGPYGCQRYGEYRNWLRDEFSFRCVYCLRRETWLTTRKDHEIDHFLPQRDHEDIENDYDNLVFACRECNGTKGAKYLPSPAKVAYGDCLRVDELGEIHAKNEQGEIMIEILRLDAPERTALRRRILETIDESSPGTKTMKWCLGYPDNLPDLSKETAPKGNKRPSGINDSSFDRRRRKSLPEYY